jgi:arylformamidase
MFHARRCLLPAMLLSLLSLVSLLSYALPAGAGPLRDRVAEVRAAHAARSDDHAARQPAGVRRSAAVAYGSDPDQRFDVYAPAKAAGAPVIFMVHGGGWKRGDKAAGSVVDNKVAFWTARGFIVISTNYRMLPEADPLVQAGDVVRALEVAQQQAAQWGGAPGKFILMGHSAGAHLVSLIASSPGLQGRARWLGTVALDSAAFDVELIMQARHLRLYDDPFGTDPAFWRAVSPYAQVTSGTRPLLAVCSTRRDDACAQARRYADKSRLLGNRVALLPQDLTHRQINDSLGEASAYTQAVDAFIASLLEEPALPH